jgi:glycosyltransferase involved in cell wall biosynthesis
MGHGAPVVAVDTVFNREVLGDAGVLVGPDARDVAESLSRRAVANAESAATGLEGCLRITDRYTWRSILDAYDSALRSSPLAPRS